MSPKPGRKLESFSGSSLSKHETDHKKGPTLNPKLLEMVMLPPYLFKLSYNK